MTIPAGFRFAGVACGIKESGNRDLVLVVSDVDAAAAGVFTTNRVCAAPVTACRRRLPATAIRGIVINSGNANACTGEQGQADAEQMTALVAQRIGCEASQVLVCSTGVIGRLLPMSKIAAGVADAYPQLIGGPDGLHVAATGIMTTDTRPKVASRSVQLAGGSANVLGFAKGAAMIGPNMATMLAFIMTDAKADSALLDRSLRAAVDKSFHCVSVEGHTSTNDTVLLLANGASGASVAGSEDLFAEAVAEVCMDLAEAIADDAEGASHKVTIDVTGTRDDAEARRIAKTVAESALVKTAIYGNDPNWGRICSAAGYAGVEFHERDLSLRVNGTLLYDRGTPTQFDEADESASMRQSRQTHIELILTLGEGRCRFWTCDLTTEYIHLNADYTT